MSNSTVVEQLLNGLMETTNEISELNLEEANVSLLLSLQVKQAQLRQDIEESLKADGRSLNEKEKQQLKECLRLERLNMKKFTQIRQSFGEQIKRIQTSKVSRNLYNHEEILYNGVFIDKQR